MGEAEDLSKITYTHVRKFFWGNVISRFKVPKEIVTDNGLQFTNNNIKVLYNNWGIKLTFATSRHPQSKRQAESTNKMAINMLNMHLENAWGRWVNELPWFMWAYQTTTKVATRETPYSLVYIMEAVLLTEVNITMTTFEPLSQEENS